MPGFVQIINWKTSRIDEVRKLQDEWRQRSPEVGPSRILVTKDRDNEGSFATVVEFDSYEEAMKNSEDPETSEFASAMAALCDGPPTFHNLDVIEVETRR